MRSFWCTYWKHTFMSLHKHHTFALTTVNINWCFSMHSDGLVWSTFALTTVKINWCFSMHSDGLVWSTFALTTVKINWCFSMHSDGLVWSTFALTTVKINWCFSMHSDGLVWSTGTCHRVNSGLGLFMIIHDARIKYRNFFSLFQYSNPSWPCLPFGATPGLHALLATSIFHKLCVLSAAKDVQRMLFLLLCPSTLVHTSKSNKIISLSLFL